VGSREGGAERWYQSAGRRGWWEGRGDVEEGGEGYLGYGVGCYGNGDCGWGEGGGDGAMK